MKSLILNEIIFSKKFPKQLSKLIGLYMEHNWVSLLGLGIGIILAHLKASGKKPILIQLLKINKVIKLNSNFLSKIFWIWSIPADLEVLKPEIIDKISSGEVQVEVSKFVSIWESKFRINRFTCGSKLLWLLMVSSNDIKGKNFSFQVTHKRHHLLDIIKVIKRVENQKVTNHLDTFWRIARKLAQIFLFILPLKFSGMM